jgi:Response regulators consisting of a CheY-like receiver domain and a winged-helix DNA-binding domain
VQTKKEILILDDNNDMRELLATVLSLKGYKVTALKDIDPSIIKQRPDLVLLDVFLSGKNGTDVCAAFKENSFTKDIPIIMFSALPDAREKCIQAGADEFILKPFKVHALHNLIKKLISKTSASSLSEKFYA